LVPESDIASSAAKFFCTDAPINTRNIAVIGRARNILFIFSSFV
jgi:hypothetical protein